MEGFENSCGIVCSGASTSLHASASIAEPDPYQSGPLRPGGPVKGLTRGQRSQGFSVEQFLGLWNVNQSG